MTELWILQSFLFSNNKKKETFEKIIKNNVESDSINVKTRIYTDPNKGYIPIYKRIHSHFYRNKAVLYTKGIEGIRITNHLESIFA